MEVSSYDTDVSLAIYSSSRSSHVLIDNIAVGPIPRVIATVLMAILKALVYPLCKMVSVELYHFFS